MLEAALLDVDGTLFNTEQLFAKGWQFAAKEKNVPLTMEQIISFHGKGHNANSIEFHKWFGDTADYWELRRIRKSYVDRWISEYGVPKKSGLMEFLDFLKRNKIKISLATGTDRVEAEPRWEKAGIIPYLDGSVCGDEVTRNKPEPEIFLKAAALVHADPKNCVVFEDSISGLEAGKAAGCHVYMVPDMDPPTQRAREICDHIVPDLFHAITEMQKQFGLK